MVATAETDDVLQEKIAMAEEAMRALAETFVPYAREEVARLSVLVTEAREAPGVNDETVQAMFQIAHNIKGQGTSFGYDLVTDVGASLSELTRGSGPRDGQSLDVIDHHARVLRTILDEDIRGDGGELGRQLVTKLRALTLKTAA